MKWDNAPQTGYIADVIDALLKADKALPGAPPPWAPGNRPSERRIAWPVLVEGTLVGLNLNITAYPGDPEYPDERFTITLNVPPCIWRLDFDPPHKRHTNPPWFGAKIGQYRIRGPNYHAWEDNRGAATPTILPPDLKCARQLPPSEVRHFRQAFRWFCDRAGIAVAHNQMFDYPPRETLI